MREMVTAVETLRKAAALMRGDDARWHPVADWLDVCADVMSDDPSVLKFNALRVADAYLGETA